MTGAAATMDLAKKCPVARTVQLARAPAVLPAARALAAAALAILVVLGGFSPPPAHAISFDRTRLTTNSFPE